MLPRATHAQDQAQAAVAILTDPGGPVLPQGNGAAQWRVITVAILTDPRGPVLPIIRVGRKT